MTGDRLEWIFDRSNFDSLEERYDAWSVEYDADHDKWGWRGPDVAAEAVVQHGNADGTVLDAGCGTGRGGVALRNAGWTGRVLGVDLSQGMLDHAEATNSYDLLLQGSLYETPLPDAAVDAVISTGVFTHGHVDGRALADLCRVTRPGGTIVITFRENIIGDYIEDAQALVDQGIWQPLERSEPLALHTGRPDAEQIKQHLTTWRVLA